MTNKINWKLLFSKSIVAMLILLANVLIVSIIPQLMWYWFGTLVVICINVGSSDWWKQKAIQVD